MVVGPKMIVMSGVCFRTYSHDNAFQMVESALKFLQVQTGGIYRHAGGEAHLFPRQCIPWLNQIPKQDK
jgi:hypothetical protein